MSARLVPVLVAISLLSEVQAFWPARFPPLHQSGWIIATSSTPSSSSALQVLFDPISTTDTSAHWPVEKESTANLDYFRNFVLRSRQQQQKQESVASTTSISPPSPTATMTASTSTTETQNPASTTTPTTTSAPTESSKQSWFHFLTVPDWGTTETEEPIPSTLHTLAREGVWTAYFDEQSETGTVYYFNERTGASQWQPPTKTFPAVSLPLALRRLAREKQQAYFARQQQQQQAPLQEPAEKAATTKATFSSPVKEPQPQQQQQQHDPSNLLSLLLAPLASAAEARREAEKLIQGSWLNTLLQDAAAANARDAAAVAAVATPLKAAMASTSKAAVASPLKVSERIITPAPPAEEIAPQPLASMGDWSAYHDREGTGYVYYFHEITGESQWDPPCADFPSFPLTEGMKFVQRKKPPQEETKPSIRPLAMLGDWAAYLDAQGTALIYYFNHRTGKSQWEAPSSDFPVVMVSKSMRKRMLAQHNAQHHHHDNDAGRRTSATPTAVKEKAEASPSSESKEDFFSQVFSFFQSLKKPAVGEKITMNTQAKNSLEDVGNKAPRGFLSALLEPLVGNFIKPDQNGNSRNLFTVLFQSVMDNKFDSLFQPSSSEQDRSNPSWNQRIMDYWRSDLFAPRLHRTFVIQKKKDGRAKHLP